MHTTHAQLKLIDISQTIDLELLFSAAALTTAGARTRTSCAALTP